MERKVYILIKSTGIEKREVTPLSQKVDTLGKLDRTVSIAGARHCVHTKIKGH